MLDMNVRVNRTLEDNWVKSGDDLLRSVWYGI